MWHKFEAMITFILTILYFLFFIGMCITVVVFVISMLITYVRILFGKEDSGNSLGIPKEIRRGLRGW